VELAELDVGLLVDLLLRPGGHLPLDVAIHFRLALLVA